MGNLNNNCCCFTEREKGTEKGRFHQFEAENLEYCNENKDKDKSTHKEDDQNYIIFWPRADQIDTDIESGRLPSNKKSKSEFVHFQIQNTDDDEDINIDYAALQQKDTKIQKEVEEQEIIQLARETESEQDKSDIRQELNDQPIDLENYKYRQYMIELQNQKQKVVLIQDDSIDDERQVLDDFWGSKVESESLKNGDKQTGQILNTTNEVVKADSDQMDNSEFYNNVQKIDAFSDPSELISDSIVNDQSMLTDLQEKSEMIEKSHDESSQWCSYDKLNFTSNSEAQVTGRDTYLKQLSLTESQIGSDVVKQNEIEPQNDSENPRFSKVIQNLELRRLATKLS